MTGSRTYICRKSSAPSRIRTFIEQKRIREHRPTHSIHVRDTKFSNDFKSTLKDAEVEYKKLLIRPPNLNARVERFVQTIKTECLDHFSEFGQDHLDYLVREFVQRYNETRPHSNHNHRPSGDQSTVCEWEAIRLADVVYQERLGGVIKSMHRRAAWPRGTGKGACVRCRSYVFIWPWSSL